MPQPNGTISRKGAKAAKKKACHFDEREKPFLRSLAFCSGMTGPSLCVLGVLARVNSRSIREKFAQGAESKQAHFRFWNWEFECFGLFQISSFGFWILSRHRLASWRGDKSLRLTREG
jgi:hypothetical protein